MLVNKKISFVKAEKVVKDPKNPMTKKGTIKSLFCILIEIKIPIK